MSSHDPVLTAALIAARCEPQINGLTRQIVAEQRSSIPDAAALPSSMLDVEMASTVRHGLRLFLRFVQGKVPSDRDMRLFRERAAQRMAEGVPLATMLGAYLIAYRAMWRALCAVTLPGEEHGLSRLGEMIFLTLEQTTTAVSEAYLQGTLRAERGEALRAVAGALLAGQEADDVAARHGVSLEPGYRVLALVLPSSEHPVAVRRRLHAAQAALDRFAGQAVLTWFGPEGGHALLPLRLSFPAPQLARHLADGGIPIHVGVSVAERRAGIPAAARQSTRIAEIARTSGRPQSLYELRDVLLDFHLSAPGASGAELSGLLDVLDAVHIETLEAYYATDFDRRATARALNVHPNTVDNRLTRISTLLAADLRTARGIMLIGTALTARRLASRG
ncbi:PucR family transcriptional regulator [Streptosporangium sp. NPDC000396]|uniref:PucR family transcriptional regulator n=1 Tax=Streptosporangium sp. NPDC000396 TaxID=3366185 RepID=UPI0036748946